jgi:hypothetical protein
MENSKSESQAYKLLAFRIMMGMIHASHDSCAIDHQTPRWSVGSLLGCVWGGEYGGPVDRFNDCTLAAK